MATRIKMVGLEVEFDGGDGRSAGKLIADSLQLFVGVASGASMSVNANANPLPAPATPPFIACADRTIASAGPREAHLPETLRCQCGTEDPADSAPKPPRKKRSKADRMVICKERPGQPMTIAEAAKLAGVLESTIGIACAPSQRGKKCGGFSFRWAEDAAHRTIPNTTRAKDSATAAHEQLSRQQIEDKTLGIICRQCGFEPDHADRTKQCPKCNSTRWEHKPQPPMVLSA